MPGPRDSTLIVRLASVGNLTADLTQTFTLDGGNPVQRLLGFSMLVPSQSGTSPTLKVTVRTKTDGKEIEVTHIEDIDDATTYPFFLHLPLPPSDDTAWEAFLDTGGTTPNFGAVEAWIEAAELAKVPAA